MDLRQTYLALTVKLVKGRGYEVLKQKNKEEHEKEKLLNSTTITDTTTSTGMGDDSDASSDTVEQNDGDPGLLTHVNNIMHSIFSNVEVYINNQQIYNSNGLYAHKAYISNNFKGAISDYRGVLHCEGYDFEEDPEDGLNTPLFAPFFQRRMKLLSRPNGFMLYGKLGVDFFTTSELLYPNMKVRIRLIRSRPNFYMISENPHVSLGIVDCSLYTRRVALKDEYHKKRKDMLAYAPVEDRKSVV